MLIGSNPLRLPPYTGTLPAVMLITCTCRRRYVVLTGVADAGADLVRAKAEARGAIYVDARAEPWRLCECGELLDFSADDASVAVM